MLAKNGLKSAILDEIKALSDEDKGDYIKVHTAYVDGIVSHVTDEMEVTGVYVGVIPAGGPDPANGSYKWPVATVPLIGATVASMVKAGGTFAAWIAAFQVGLALCVFNPVAGGPIAVTATPPLILSTFVCTIAQPSFAGCEDLDTTVDTLADLLVADLKNTIPLPAPVPAVTPTGTGVVTFSTIS